MGWALKGSPAMLNAFLSLVPPSFVKEVGSLLLLIGLSGDVAIVVVRVSRKVLEKGLAVIFSVLVLAGVGLEWLADQPRSINETRVTNEVKQFAGTPFDFSVNLDPESVDLMESIGRALTAAGWVRQPIAGGFGFINPGKPPAGITAFSGLEVQITDSRESQWGSTEQAAAILWHALQKERLTATAKHVPDNQESPSAIHIKVGAKP